jgi:hypothetical protein
MWRSTEYEDLFGIKLADASSWDPEKAFDAVEDEEARRTALKEDARTWLDDDGVLAVVGVDELWSGVGVVWTLITERSRERGFALTRNVLREIGKLHNKGYWRLQATVARGDEEARLWIVRLGFSFEGTMVAYGPNKETHDMYARVRQ